MHKEVVLSIDVGGTNTVFGLVDSAGHCEYKNSIPTKSEQLAEGLFHKVFSILEQDKASWERSGTLKGVGIGAPNANYYTGDVKSPPNLSWTDINLRDFVQEILDIPVAVTNDANAAALGEMHYGVAKDMRHFVEITLGTGLGSGIVVDGKVVYGHDGFAGELGHVNAIHEGRTCGCGNHGCLETYASATGIVKTAIERLSADKKTSALSSIDPDKLSSKDVFQAAIDGDELCQEVFEWTGELLGRILSNTVVHTSPEAFIFFGGMAQAGNLILDPVKRSLNKHVMPVFKGKTKVLKSGLPGDDAAILGAAALIWEELKSVDSL